jgi:hypothetical protein
MNGDTPTCNGTSDAADGIQLPFIIPIDLCPEEISLYAFGKTLGLRVTGNLTPDGVEVQEVTLIR